MDFAVLEWYEATEAAEQPSPRLGGTDSGPRGLRTLGHCSTCTVEALFAAGRGELEAARALAIQRLGTEPSGSTIPFYTVLPLTLLACLDLWTGQPAAAHDRLRPFREAFVSKRLWVHRVGVDPDVVGRHRGVGRTRSAR